MRRPYRIINVDHGPSFCGVGDVFAIAHVSAGTKGTTEEVRLRSDNKRDVLALLGEENYHRPIGLCPSPIFDIEKKCRGNISRVEQIRRHFGITAEPKRPKLVIPKEAKEFAGLWWGNETKRVLLCYEVNDNSRRWPHWGALRRMLHGLSFSRFLEKNNCEESWANAAAIIDMADVVVAIDSAYAHIAATLGKKTVVILGPTRPTAFSHASDCVTCITPPEDDSCTGCVFNEPFHERKCGHIGCAQIGKISPEQVLDEVKRCLKCIVNTMVDS